MDAGILVPLGCFAMVVILVALPAFAKIRDKEVLTHTTLAQAELEHRARIANLDREIEQLRKEA